MIQLSLFDCRDCILVAAALSVCACSPNPGLPESEAPASELFGQGEAMAENLCAGCHAVYAADQSKHPDAPPLRHLSQRVDLDELRSPLQEGFVADHPDMPGFAFEPQHVDALLFYLQSIQSADE